MVARTVMVLVPTSNGTAAMLQAAVPLAVPDVPVELVQVTEAMPPLSRAVPLRESEVAIVEKLVDEGELSVKLGGPAVLALGGR